MTTSPRPGPPAPTASPAAPPSPVPAPPPSPGGGPAGGDLVVESAMRELTDADPHDLDAVLAAAEGVLATLQDRLRDLGD